MISSGWLSISLSFPIVARSQRCQPRLGSAAGGTVQADEMLLAVQLRRLPVAFKRDLLH